MKVNTKIRYGLRVMIELGLHEDHDNAGMFQKNIAENQQLSEKYLDPIISALKVSGLITNAGGKKSGYILNKPRKEITVYDVYRSFEPEPSIIHCVNKPVTCFISRICVANEFWMGLNDNITKYLKKTTLDDIIKKHKKILENIRKANNKTDHCK
ncbi:MAG: Rrf2 family transcriptional regulator [Bacteroidetes bacterium]|nr:Rrf2 family transcriptional regulator [Bacteroidota bacterium]